MKRIFGSIIQVLGSYGLAIIVMFFLLLLTFLGTIDQTRLGLYEVQKRYFESAFLIYDLQPALAALTGNPDAAAIGVPLPGVYLLLVILSINLVVGTILRMRRRRENIGLYVVHAGMLYMLLAGLVTHEFAVDGQMTLAPNETSSKFHSYHHWELAIIDPSAADKQTEYLIPASEFSELPAGATRKFFSPALPFELEVSGYRRNARVMPKGPMFEAPTSIVDGFFIMPLDLEKENERNLPAIYLTITDRQSGQASQKILWGNSVLPLTIEAGGKPWQLELRRESWIIPFSITLKEFRRELHPGTEMAKSYESDVIKTEDGVEQEINIRMNEPLRNRGYTFFQASFSQDPKTGQFLSTFAVVRNPADQWPLYSCIVITIGMLLHFGLKLSRYLRRQRAGEAARPVASTATAESIAFKPIPHVVNDRQGQAES